MVAKIEDREQFDINKKNQPLTPNQKLLFGLICWGVQSWSKANRFKTNGYDQKYIDSKNAMYTGLVAYSLSITLFVLILFLLK